MLQAQVTLAAIVALGTRAAMAGSDVEACATASEQAQQLLTAHQLDAAREQLLACTRVTCPAPIREDCDALLSQTDAAMPTIVVVIEDAHGREVVGAAVTLDGKPIALDGKPIALDPGRHVVRAAAAHARATDVVVIAHEGEKNRRVVARLAPRAARGRHVTATSLALGSLGGLALGAFAYLAVSGQGDVDRCNRAGCTQPETDAIARKRIYAWSALGIGIAASAASVYVYATATGPEIAVAGTF